MADPLELLTLDPDRKPPFLTAIFNPLACATFGFAFACFQNYALRKPVFSGIQKHIVYPIIGGAIGGYIDKRRNSYLSDRDAMLRHYVELHSEDFPPRERKKYSEILEKWAPIR